MGPFNPNLPTLVQHVFCDTCGEYFDSPHLLHLNPQQRDRVGHLILMRVIFHLNGMGEYAASYWLDWFDVIWFDFPEGGSR